MLHQHKHDVLIGNWEEPGVIGTRIEISPSRVQVLWRNTTVLDTAYSVKEDSAAGTLQIRPRRTGLRYPQSASDYAAVTALFYENGVLHYRVHFPISGDSETLLKRTENSRYGNFTIADDEILPQLQGRWIDDHAMYPIRIRGNRMTIGDDVLPFHVLQSRSGYPPAYKIVHTDPTKDGLFHFSEVLFDGSEITAFLHVCDAPSVQFRYHKA